MQYGKQIIAGLYLLLSVIVSPSTCSYSKWNLSKYCQNSSRPNPMTISCEPEGLSRAGTILFTRAAYPATSCNATLTVELDSPSCSNTTHYAIYLNVKYLNLEEDDSMEIYENGSLVKRLPGGSQSSSRRLNPTSYAQLLSTYDPAPTLTFQFIRGTKPATVKQFRLTLDYVLLRSYDAWQSDIETICPALQRGTMLDEHFCDNTQDRVSCPTEYHADVDLNPARNTAIGLASAADNIPHYCYGTQFFTSLISTTRRPPPVTMQSTRRSPRMTTAFVYDNGGLGWNLGHGASNHIHDYSIPSYGMPYSSYRLTGVAIAGIIFGVLFVVIFMVFLLLHICNQSRRARAVSIIQTADGGQVNFGATSGGSYSREGRVTYIAQSADDLCSPSGVANELNFMTIGAPPPAYSTVYPVDPSEEAPKY